MLVLFTPVLVRRRPSAPGPFTAQFGSEALLALPGQWQTLEVQEDHRITE